MSDIFLSYSREDRARAERLAGALESAGWSVWWDRKIPFGQGFDDVTAEALATARCVVVLWTQHSVKSDWVRAEASEGQARKVLIPVRLDAAAELPLAFKRLQTADLCDWEPGSPHLEYDLLLHRIRVLVTAAVGEGVQPGVPAEQGARGIARASGHADMPPFVAPPAPVGDDTAKQPKSSLKRRRAWAVTSFIVLPTFLVGAVALALDRWRVSTPIQADLLVDRVDFRVAGTGDVPVLAAAPTFRWLELESFSRIALTPADGGLEVAARRSDGSAGWTHSPATGQMVLLGEAAPASTVTFTNPDREQGPAGRIGDIKVAPGALVIAELSGPGVLTLTLQGQHLSPNVSANGRLQLEAKHVSAMPQLEGWSAGNPIRFRVALHRADPFVQIESLPEEFKLKLEPAKESPVDILPATQVSAIRVAKEGDGGMLKSALRGEGTMSYPGYGGKEKVRFLEQERPVFEGLRDAEITKLRFDPRTGAIELAVAAEATAVWSEITPQNRKDHRLTALDKLWYGSKTAIIFAICAWVLSFLFGVYKLYNKPD